MSGPVRRQPGRQYSHSSGFQLNFGTQIYRNALLPATGVSIRAGCYTRYELTSQLLRVCSHIHREGTNILYRENVFLLTSPDEPQSFLERIGPWSSASIKSVNVLFDHNDDEQDLPWNQLANRRDLCFADHYHHISHSATDYRDAPDLINAIVLYGIMCMKDWVPHHFNSIVLSKVQRASEEFKTSILRRVFEQLNRTGCTIRLRTWICVRQEDAVLPFKEIRVWYQIKPDDKQEHGFEALFLKEKACDRMTSCEKPELPFW
ncbi:hypothetical protein EJ08DRAFT_702678 [Tothia fuscella]|uniref:Uncharacterized protein n=1 Tax=Tothia fuscella TaxID=1048955 RepID=A0A9P4NG83_9PEZI|nr:hypothetical protein EJ08DRAFT_702678 [Tothia fuscella]